ncbi:glycosyltransferase [Mastigocoleus testarum]|uniref:Glycosyl transferase family 1 n=1 Tax=Mastigocoleus testarum BC008 TaxID=371196 RepID=A0A0V7ZSP5_9CYAN|nr:glycosyltransferase [Mastigocoleus testarum]KST67684.1 glycosyl transferase family 1 [Mastigocoleus testarum BC008]
MKKHVTFFMTNLHSDADKLVINLLKGILELDKDVYLDLVVANKKGGYLNQIPKQVRIINLESHGTFKAIVSLSQYLREHQPNTLISHTTHTNAIAVLARFLVQEKIRLVLVEDNTLFARKSKSFQRKFFPILMKLLYRYADAIVGVSYATARDLESRLGLRTGKVKIIYNPVVDSQLTFQANESFNHPWFQKGAPPVFLAMGRLTQQKDFATLIKAFSILRSNKVARLMIIGEGELRGELEYLTKKLGIAQDVAIPSFVKNPYVYMKNASAFVMSSRWESLGNVLIEAMACGCPVVSTDCPHGPREILAAGKYGILVPVEDVFTLSYAMLKVLETPIRTELLVRRANYFSVRRSVSKYLAISNI